MQKNKWSEYLSSLVFDTDTVFMASHSQGIYRVHPLVKMFWALDRDIITCSERKFLPEIAFSQEEKEYLKKMVEYGPFLMDSLRLSDEQQAVLKELRSSLEQEPETVELIERTAGAMWHARADLPICKSWEELESWLGKRRYQKRKPIYLVMLTRCCISPTSDKTKVNVTLVVSWGLQFPALKQVATVFCPEIQYPILHRDVRYRRIAVAHIGESRISCHHSWGQPFEEFTYDIDFTEEFWVVRSATRYDDPLVPKTYHVFTRGTNWQKQMEINMEEQDLLRICDELPRLTDLSREDLKRNITREFQRKKASQQTVQDKGNKMGNEFYAVRVICDNCDFEGQMSLPKGRLMRETLCPECGNKTVRKVKEVIQKMGYSKPGSSVGQEVREQANVLPASPDGEPLSSRQQADGYPAGFSMKKTRKPTVVGILDLLSGTVGLITSLVYLGKFSVLSGDAELMGILVLVAVISALAIAGGIFALIRRRWGLVLAGSIGASIASIIWPLGIAAIVFTVMSKNEFE